MQSVGQKLRHAREAQGRTLEQVNSSTRISLRNLRAIEADEITAIGSPFLYRSFVRQFAEDLNLNYADLETAIQESADRIPAPLIPGQGVSAVPRVTALPIGRRQKGRLLYSISSFALMLVACSGIYALWQNSKFSLPALQKIAKTRLTTLAVPALKPASHPVAAPEKSDSEANTVKSQPASAADRSDKFTLEVSATEPAWLSIVADGKPSFKGILEKAETKVLAGYSSARIRTGNAGGVEVVFNGKPLGALGPRGQVRTVLFTQNNYEVLKTPVHISLVTFSQTAAPELFPQFPEPLPGS
jgi:cytoskeleton protein RodZ